MNERDDLKAYLDGELTEARAEEVRLALERDPDLREEYTFMKLLTKEIQSSAKEPEVKGVDGARAAARRRPWFLKPPALLVEGIAALFVIGFVGSTMFPDMSVGAGQDSMAKSLARSEIARKMPYSGADAAAASPKTEAAPMTEKPSEMADAEAKSGKDMAKAPLSEGFVGGRVNGTVTTSPTSPPATVPNVGQREVVKNGSLGVKVKDTKQAMQEVTDTVKAMGGFVESSNVSVNDSDTVGYMALRVPASSFETLVNNVRRMGEVMSEALGGQDVTGAIADMGARLKVLRGEEESYVQMLRQSRRLQDTLDLRDRLSNVRQEIESIDAQKRALAGVASMSTLNVQFSQPKSEPVLKPGDWFGDATNGATKTLLEVGRTVISGALYVAILSPVWAPVALLVWWVSRRRKAA